jgi:hypothetical protein
LKDIPPLLPGYRNNQKNSVIISYKNDIDNLVKSNTYSKVKQIDKDKIRNSTSIDLKDSNRNIRNQENIEE